MLAWSALVADVAATAWLNTADVALWLKLVVDGLEVFGSYTILVYYQAVQRVSSAAAAHDGGWSIYHGRRFGQWQHA
jgi:hypothetical protein